MVVWADPFSRGTRRLSTGTWNRRVAEDRATTGDQRTPHSSKCSQFLSPVDVAVSAENRNNEWAFGAMLFNRAASAARRTLGDRG